MGDFTNLTQEQIFAAEAYFNLATMVGKCLEISVYQLNHPDYKPNIFVTPSGNDEEEPEQEEEKPSASVGQEPTPISSGRIKSNELSEYAQMHQLFCLYDPRIKQILGPSSLYEMFHLASSLFSYEFKSPDQEPSPLDRKKIAVAWVIVKRTFAINHMQEALHLLNLPDVIAGDLVYKSQPVGFPMDEQDRRFIISACKVCEDVVFNKIPLEQVINDALRAIEKEKKASQSLILPPLGSVPNGDPLNFLLRVMSGKQEYITDNRSNRHERITKVQKGNTIRIIKANPAKGSQISVEIRNANKYLNKANKTFIKILFFVLQKMNEQHYPLEVGFTLQELVELEMYSSTKNAWRGVQEFIKQQSDIFLTGLLKRKDDTEIEVKGNAGLLFYNVSLDNGYVRISVNDKFNFDFIASAYTVFPRFAYKLKNINAFNLVVYIFFIARQHLKDIKDKGQFTINLDAVRSRLGLPAPENVKNRRYRQLIIEPIETAIEEIEEALKTLPEAKECSFTITPVGTDTSNINQWLDGYLEIQLKNDFAQKFIKLAKEFESTQEKVNRARIKEIARLSAKKEAEKTAVLQ